MFKMIGNDQSTISTMLKSVHILQESPTFWSKIGGHSYKKSAINKASVFLPSYKKSDYGLNINNNINEVKMKKNNNQNVGTRLP